MTYNCFSKYHRVCMARHYGCRSISNTVQDYFFEIRQESKEIYTVHAEEQLRGGGKNKLTPTQKALQALKASDKEKVIKYVKKIKNFAAEKKDPFILALVATIIDCPLLHWEDVIALCFKQGADPNVSARVPFAISLFANCWRR